MNRRTALKVLGIATIGALAGKITYASDYVSEGNVLQQPNRILWDMDSIEIIEIRKGGESIKIKTQEIFEALK